MDFLEIRRKAKERAAARARAARGTAARGGAKRRSRRGRHRPEVPGEAGAVAEAGVVTEADVVEGALMAEMQGRSEPPGPPGDGFVIVRGPPAASPAGEESPSVPAAAGGPEGAAAGRPEAEPALPAPAGEPPATAAAVDPLDEFFFSDEEAPPAAAGAARAEAAPETLRELLVFALAGEEFALDIEVVREILKAPPITEVPRAPGHILGITMVRGQVIAVHDPRRRLGLAPAPAGPSARVVVCDAGEGPVGLLVDGVSQVLRLSPAALEPRPQGIAGIDSEFIAGVGRAGERFFVLLDAGALLSRRQADGGAA